MCLCVKLFAIYKNAIHEPAKIELTDNIRNGCGVFMKKLTRHLTHMDARLLTMVLYARIRPTASRIFSQIENRVHEISFV